MIGERRGMVISFSDGCFSPITTLATSDRQGSTPIVRTLRDGIVMPGAGHLSPVLLEPFSQAGQRVAQVPHTGQQNGQVVPWYEGNLKVSVSADS